MGNKQIRQNTNNPGRVLRKNMTEAENYLWQLIRDRRLNGYKFRRQHPIGGYILDFYCPSKKLAVELDGSQHDILVQKHSDNKRTKDLLKMGIHVIRF